MRCVKQRLRSVRTALQRPPSVRATSTDGGFTLVESVLTIALTGLVVVAVLAGVRTTILASRIAYDSAQVETVLLNAADRVNRAPQKCNYDLYVDAAGDVYGWGDETTSIVVERLVANTGALTTDWGSQPCPAAVQAFDVQRLTITVTTPDGKITRNMTVYKSRES